MHYSEALKSKAVDWLDWNDLWIGVHKKSLKLYPFFLLITEVIGTLPLLNLFVELIDDNRDEQVHNEEGNCENVDDVEQTDQW